MNQPVDVDGIVADLNAAFATLRAEVTEDYTAVISERAEHAVAILETFCAISVRIIKQTNPSKLRAAAAAEEIKARIHGREVLEG